MFPQLIPHSTSSFTLIAPLLALALLTFVPSATAADPVATSAANTSASADAATSYKDVALKELVEKSKTEIPGQRIVFAPSPVKFQARLAAMPAPQKTEYLMSALAMMKVSTPPKVSQRIGLDYGGDKALAAYIDDAIVERLTKNAKPGQMLTFYAFHVYNNNRGPALLVTSFSE